MHINFNEQDLINAVCVLVASRDNDNIIEDSCLEDVRNVQLHFEPAKGITATARLYGYNKVLSEQDVIDAVAVYLSHFHNFCTHQLLVNLNFNVHEGFSANVAVN